MQRMDDLTLNYLVESREDNFGEPDALMKGLNKTGLVQKEVQVRGKNGQIFTRKQWVKASEDVSQPKQSGGSDDLSGYFQSKGIQGVSSSKDAQNKLNSLEQQKKDIDISLRTTQMGTKSYADGQNKKRMIDKQIHQLKSAMREVPAGKVEEDDSNISQDVKTEDNKVPFELFTLTYKRGGNDYHEKFKTLSELKQALDYHGLPESLSDLDIKDLDKENGYVKKHYKQYSVHAYPPIPDTHNTPNNSVDTNKISKELVDKLEHSGDPSTPKETQHNGFKIKVFYSGKIRIFKEDTEVLSTYSKIQAAEYLDKKSKQNKDSSVTKEKENKPDNYSNQSSFSTPSNKQDLAKLLQSGVSREDIMSQAEKDGITWKKSDHPGINWMRCSMAMTSSSTKGDKKDSDSQSEKVNSNKSETVKGDKYTDALDDGVKDNYSVKQFKFKDNFITPRSKSMLDSLLQRGVSREDIMSQAEKDGITWKKSDNAGINWMRASMAMIGTTTKNREKSKSESSSNSTQKSDKKEETNKGVKYQSQQKSTENKNKEDKTIDEELGELVHTYPDGTKQYRKVDTEVSRNSSEARFQFIAMESVIKRDFENKMRISRADYDYDRETGMFTAWVSDLPVEVSKGKFERVNGKVLFNTSIKGTKVTDVKSDGTKDEYYTDSSYAFEVAGTKY